ncbi:hypothetical protein NE237_027376 [Protea cynaroides]|uniref:Uncharacterized protein n=1 Tax=Protea cynaroides TaxID=273540 RepID=A0A9Q0GRR0_9MAGN|nr:hypothetical protein NE237_027376 [Protea cynaroides]
MTLDPQSHGRSSVGSIVMSAASANTRHMAQWESARLEAEARLSKESIPNNLNPSPSSSASSSSSEKPDSSYYFLRIWNSEIGESFQRLSQREQPMVVACQSSSISLASILTKCGSGQDGDVVGRGGGGGGSGGGSSEMSISNERAEMEESLERSLRLLLDFPSLGFFFQGQMMSNDISLENFSGLPLM